MKEVSKAVQRVISRLGLSRYVKAILNQDATRYQIDPGERIDILLSETMQAGLLREQQVSYCFEFTEPAGCQYGLNTGKDHHSFGVNESIGL